MKNVRKIVALFALIFIIGIYLVVETVNSSLNKVDEKPTPQETVEIQKDTLYQLKAEKKTKRV